MRNAENYISSENLKILLTKKSWLAQQAVSWREWAGTSELAVGSRGFEDFERWEL